MARLSRRFRLYQCDHWPGPRSLATTCGVSVDVLSSGYLDVSVRRVRFSHLCIQWKIPPKRWVAPFGNPRIKACSRLPMAYRNVLRPSSPLSAKASTRCPSYACSTLIVSERHAQGQTRTSAIFEKMHHTRPNRMNRRIQELRHRRSRCHRRITLSGHPLVTYPLHNVNRSRIDASMMRKHKPLPSRDASRNRLPGA